MSGIFLYANADPTIPLDGSDGTHCGIYICADMDSVTGLSLFVEKPPGTPAGILNEPRTFGFPNVDGLYNVRAQMSIAGDFTYAVTVGFGGTSVGEVLIIWTEPDGSLCPLWPATPPPVLTASSGIGGILLNWTASVSADPHYWSIEYAVEQFVSGSFTGIAYLHDTLAYVDTDVLIGNTYTYRVSGREPVIGGGTYSNIVTITHTGIEAGRAAWGMIAR